MSLAESIQKRIDQYFPGLLGIEIKEAGPDKIVARLKVRANLCTAGSVLHGGAYMAFADTVGAVGTIVNLPPNARTTTIESKTNFMGSAPVDTYVTAESIPLHKGKSTQVWQTSIRSESGKLCAVVTQTQMILPA